MRVFIALALFVTLSSATPNPGLDGVVTPDILHRVSAVLSHGYGTKVLLSYPQKAHLVDFSHSAHIDPYHGHAYGNFYGHSYGHGHGNHGHYYASPAYHHYGGHGHHQHHYGGHHHHY